MKKVWFFLGSLTLALAVLSSCTSSADTLPSPSPSMMPSASPMASPMASPITSPMVSPSTSPMEGAGVTTLEDSVRISERVTDEVEKLSEIKDAEAVVAGGLALVGVTYDTQYQGGLTSRLTEMIDTRVQSIDKGLTTVHVTDDAKMIAEIEKLEDMAENNQITFSELQAKLLELTSGMGNGTSTGMSTGAGTGTT